MQLKGEFCQGLGCLLKIKQFSGAKVHLNISVKNIQCFISGLGHVVESSAGSL